MRQNRIAKFVKVMPPPSNPMDTDEYLLERLQSCTRIQFPADFIEFGRVYGSSTITSAYG